MQEIKTSIVEFVIEKSKFPINIGIMRLIENCSKGENSIKKKKTKKVTFQKMKGQDLNLQHHLIRNLQFPDLTN